MFVAVDYDGWTLLECSSNPEDKVAALKEQKQIWENMVSNAQARL